MSENKTCTKCERSLTLNNFDKAPRSRDGRRNICRRCRGSVQRRAAPLEQEETPKFSRPLLKRRLLITAAQNATPVHAPFLAALKTAAEHLDADLVVVPLRYKNPTSIWSKRDESDNWWDPAVQPYLFNARKKLGPNLVLCADVKVQPTAVSPLSGFEALTGAESCIVAHPKMQFRPIAAPSGRFPKVLTTTGACTKRNYTDTRAGKLGDFHHYLGALIVELDGKHFHLRQINADRRDGSFTDLDQVYTAGGVSKAPPAAGLVLGDTHARLTSLSVDKATFGPGGIVETLDPETVVFHDLFDGVSVNPHHTGNPFIAAAKAGAKLGDVRAEVEHAVEFVRARCVGRKAVIVASNHDDFLSRWLMSTDWRHSPGNAKFYLETAQALLASARMGPGGAEYSDPFAHWVNKLKGNSRIRCLGRDERFAIKGNECSLHGHRGPNGAKSTMKNLARIGAKVVSGHGHTPGIEEGHYRVGTSTELKLEYTAGSPSSWLNTHCVIYASGKRALITIVDGEWRLPPST